LQALDPPATFGLKIRASLSSVRGREFWPAVGTKKRIIVSIE